LAILAIPLAITALVYLPSLWGATNFDDHQTLLRNRSLGDWGTSFAALFKLQGRGLFWLSATLDHSLWGRRWAGYHLTSLLLHLLNTALLMLLAGRIARRRGEGNPEGIAFCAGLLFGIHPLASSTVCYLSQRSAILAATGALLTFHALLAFAADGVGPGRRIRLAALALFAWTLGCLGKQTAGTVPLSALALLLLLPKGEGRRALAALLGWGTLLALALGTFLLVDAMRVPHQRTFWDLYALTQFRVVWRYLGLCLLPFHQGADPHVALSQDWMHPSSSLLGALALGVLALLLWMRRGRWPWATAGVLAALFALLPESSVIALGDPMFEYRMYLPGLWLALAAAPCLAGLMMRRGSLALLLALLAAWLTRERTLVWKDDVLLWREALRHAPKALRTHANLAADYASEGHYEASEKLIGRSLKIERTPDQYRDLARLALERRDVPAGMDALDQAFLLEPERPDCLATLGRLHLLKGDYLTAARILSKAWTLYPDDEEIPAWLATALSLGGKVPDRDELLGALRDRQDPRALLVFGSALGSRGNSTQAIPFLEAYTRAKPEDPIGWANLSQAYGGLGRREEAARARGKAVEACGDNPGFSAMKQALLGRALP